MNNYSDTNLESLKKDLDKTIEECRELVKNLKASKDIKLNSFNNINNSV